MTTPTSSSRTTTASSTDDALHAGEHALHQTRQLASQAFEKAGEKVRELRQGAQDLAHKGISEVADKAAAAQQQLGRYAEATGRYVAERPVKSALIAAAAGALVAGVVIAARRRKEH